MSIKLEDDRVRALEEVPAPRLRGKLWGPAKAGPRSLTFKTATSKNSFGFIRLKQQTV